MTSTCHVNPVMTSQVHGSVAQGIGRGLVQGVIAYSEEGQLLTASYQDYCVPRADDIPPISVTLDDSSARRTRSAHGRAKGCGEFRRHRQARPASPTA